MSVQACLGVGAKPSEVNIVTLSTQDANGEDLTLPIAWLSEHNPQVGMLSVCGTPWCLTGTLHASFAISSHLDYF